MCHAWGVGGSRSLILSFAHAPVCACTRLPMLQAAPKHLRPRPKPVCEDCQWAIDRGMRCPGTKPICCSSPYGSRACAATQSDCKGGLNGRDVAKYQAFHVRFVIFLITGLAIITSGSCTGRSPHGGIASLGHFQPRAALVPPQGRRSFAPGSGCISRLASAATNPGANPSQSPN